MFFLSWSWVAKDYHIKCLTTATFKNVVVFNKDIHVFGKGSNGPIIIRPSEIDFGTVMVNHKQVKKLLIHNLGDCNFYVHLQLEVEKMDPVMDNLSLNSCFMLDFTEGLVAGRITKEVNLTFFPKEICAFRLKLNLFVKNGLK